MGILESSFVKNTNGAKAYTVGSGGMFSTIIDAADYLSGLTRRTELVTKTVSYSSTGSKHMLTIDSPDNAFSTWQGQYLYFVVDAGEDILVPCKVSDEDTLIIAGEPYTSANWSSISITLISIERVTIALLPGNHVIDSDIDVVTLPEVITLASSIPYGATLHCLNSSALIANAKNIVIDETSTDCIISNLVMKGNADVDNGAHAPIYQSGNALGDTYHESWLSRAYIRDVIGDGGFPDWYLQAAAGVTSGAYFNNVDINAVYDCIRCYTQRELNVANSKFRAESAVNGGADAACIVIGENAAKQNVTVMNSQLETANNTFGYAVGVEFRTKLNTDDTVLVVNNHIKVTNDSVSAFNATGVGFPGAVTTGAETPRIDVISNTFDIQNGSGGDKYAMVTDTYTFNQGNNKFVGGNTGTKGTGTFVDTADI